MESIIQTHSKLKQSLVFHLNKIGSLIVYILLPEELKNNPKQMRFLHKCESNQLEIKIKNTNNQILINYTYNFDDNSFSVINIKNTLPKIISLSLDTNNSNNIKYLMINYSITKSAINDYYFTGKILNYDTTYDYLEKLIEKSKIKSFKKIKLENVYCANCNNKLFINQKEIIYDYDSIRIEQNLEEFFNCQNNYNSFMENKDATHGIENLKKAYETKYNMDTLFLWIFEKYLESPNENDKNKIEFLFCEKCKEIIGIKEEFSNILFNKLFLNLIIMDLVIDNDENNKVIINEFFSSDFLNILLTESIKKGNKILKFINVKQNVEIIFDTKINILGLIDKDLNNIDESVEKFLINNYVNMFEVNIGKIENDKLLYEEKNNVILNEKDFILLQKIIKENIEFYFSELFFYKLLTNENKKYYCLSLPKLPNSVIANKRNN